MADAPTTELLRQGILAAKAGNARQAEQLLRQVIANDRNNEAAWLWMSSVVEDPADIVLCLEHVLVINQHHIIVDAWSIGVLLRELCVAYAAFSLPSLK